MTESLKESVANFPDKRTRKNKIYSIEDIALGAFSIFFTQSPSFLAHQKAMEEVKGKNNANTLFGINKIPTDNHIRDLLDQVSPEYIFPVFDTCINSLNSSGHLDEFRILNNDLLVAIDGTWYFSSKKIHCDNCSTIRHDNGSITYYHCIVTSVIVSPKQDKVISLIPEFVMPQDGHNKQDCESSAAKRWIRNYAGKYNNLNITILGDDLYSNQSLCKELLNNKFNFILVCKPDSHKTLYEWVELLEEGLDRHTTVTTKHNGRFKEIHTYRYANSVPLRDSKDALYVNWFEITITREDGKILYKNTFITNHKITDKNIESLVLCGRDRWKVENENINTLKTKGYNIEHNYGHGEKNLSSLFATFVILAFLFHTILELIDKRYYLIRKKLPTRKAFFDHIRTLTYYMCFKNFDHLMDFMFKGLELQY